MISSSVKDATLVNEASVTSFPSAAKFAISLLSADSSVFSAIDGSAVGVSGFTGGIGPTKFGSTFILSTTDDAFPKAVGKFARA